MSAFSYQLSDASHEATEHLNVSYVAVEVMFRELKTDR
jgi:hypothetical protein